MRIAHLILTRHFAGSERHAVELANAQAASQEVWLILRRSASGSHADAFADRVSPQVRLVLVPDWLPAWHAARALRRIRPDVAHAHLGGACRAVRGLPGPCLRVATLHICYKPHQHAALDALVAIAPWQLDAIPQPLRAHTAQIDNWVLPQPATPGARAALRTAHGIPSDAWVFGAVGRIEASKGIDVLIDAFERANLPNAWLVVVGRGPALERLRRRAPPRVLLPGFARIPADWLETFDAFVSAAHSEPFGLVFLEAMQAGLPVIATRTAGALHLAPVMQPALVPLGDKQALADALDHAAQSHPPRRNYRLDGYRIESRLNGLNSFYAQELARSHRIDTPPAHVAPDAR